MRSSAAFDSLTFADLAVTILPQFPPVEGQPQVHLAIAEHTAMFGPQQFMLLGEKESIEGLLQYDRGMWQHTLPALADSDQDQALFNDMLNMGAVGDDVEEGTPVFVAAEGSVQHQALQRLAALGWAIQHASGWALTNASLTAMQVD